MISECWCDPVAKTSDCFPSKCNTFFAIFFPFHATVLISFIVFVILVEYRSTQKGPLWRIILGFGIVAEFGIHLFIHHIFDIFSLTVL